MSDFNRFIGLDVHKVKIAVAFAEQGRTEPTYFGEIFNEPDKVEKFVKKICKGRGKVGFCYEAGPCGYELYRQIKGLGHSCVVIAPSLIPKKAGDRIKTDRRDALSLARLYRSGDLTPIWVPGPEQEAVRDLTRAREGMKEYERMSRQRLNAFLLRNGISYSRTKWCQLHYRWLEKLKFDQPVQQIVFQELVDTEKQSRARVARLENEMLAVLETWEWAPVVEALTALRGIKFITAMTIIAELGDLSRFEAPKQLMAYLGVVPSEYSSGNSHIRGRITKAGNGHVRRVLVESAWTYRYPARKTALIERRAEKSSENVQAIAWKAQVRLCKRYRRLVAMGKNKNKVCIAIARELIGFIWAITQQVMKEDKLMAKA